MEKRETGSVFGAALSGIGLTLMFGRFLFPCYETKETVQKPICWEVEEINDLRAELKYHKTMGKTYCEGREEMKEALGE